MVLPRSDLATKGIVPFDLIKHDLIKSFSHHNLIKSFFTPSVGFFFFFAEMNDYITPFTLTAHL